MGFGGYALSRSVHGTKKAKFRLGGRQCGARSCIFHRFRLGAWACAPRREPQIVRIKPVIMDLLCTSVRCRHDGPSFPVPCAHDAITLGPARIPSCAVKNLKHTDTYNQNVAYFLLRWYNLLYLLSIFFLNLPYLFSMKN